MFLYKNNFESKINQVVSNQNIATVKDDFRIVCALINCYRPPRVQNKENDEIIAGEMLEKSKKTNDLKAYAEQNKRKNKKNESINENALNFPILTEDYIREITFGVYQLKQAKSYSREHLNQDGSYTFEFIKEKPNLIRVKLNSRHLPQTIYNTFIEFDTKPNSSKPITSWYCDCKAGARVVGTCAHVASVIWYLGVARNRPEQLKNDSASNYEKLCQDASSIKI